MSGNEVFQKYEHVKHILRNYKKVAIAFSGGIDSSLLLFAASEVLKKEQVLAIHARSVLNNFNTDTIDFFRSFFSSKADLEIVRTEPLTWPDFIQNSKDRCYFCKKKIYTLFKHKTEELNYRFLDGTNADDLLEDRPGLSVLKELNVSTPLAEAGICKKEVRFLARSLGLPNHDLPSNSCLATRIGTGEEITGERLSIIQRVEEELKSRGFFGARAKLFNRKLIIEIRQQDYLKFNRINNRIHFLSHCKDYGIEQILLNISGR